MSQKAYREFYYSEKEDYDKELKINDEKLKVYSEKKLKERYPENDYIVVGETFEKKKRDRENDIGRIELNEKRLYVSDNGKHNKLFKKQGAFAEVEGGGFIAILKFRLIPIILIITLIIGCVGGALFGICGGGIRSCDDDIDPNIKPVEAEILTISGIVTKDGKLIEDASLSLQSGNEEVGKATTDKDGKYLISDVKNGSYNLVCTYKESVLTKIAIVNGMSIIVNFTFPADDLHDVEEITGHNEKEDLPDIKPTNENTDVKALVKVPEGTPAIAVGGLDTEAMLHMIVGKEVDITFLAEKLDESKVPEAEKKAITAISGELNLTYFDFSVMKEIFKDSVLESTEYLKKTKTVLEVAVNFDSSSSVGTYAFRYHNGGASRFEELSEKPTDNFKDGTCYITADTVYIYTNCFSTYAIGSASVGHIVKGSDTISYSDKATVNLKTDKIDMMYKHDKDSTNDAKLELYIVGENSNLLIAESGTIPVGYQLNEMTLKSGVKNMPSVGTYNGLMKIIYLGTDGDTATNVDIPLSIAITQ